MSEVESLVSTVDAIEIARPGAFRSGDVLLTIVGSIGRVALHNITQRAVFQRSVASIRPGPTLSAAYLAWAMRSQIFQSELMLRARQSAQAGVYLSDIASIGIPVPDLSAQSRITNFLDHQVARIDSIIAARRRQLDLAREENQVKRDTLTLNGIDTAEMCAPIWNPFGQVPVKWRQTQLRSTPAIIQTGPFGSQLHSDEYVDAGWPIVNPAGLKNSRIYPIPGMSVTDEVRQRLSRHLLRQGDVVFGRRGELGRAALVTAAEAGWVLGTGSLMVRLTNRELLLPGFLVRLLETAALRHYFDAVAVGSTMANLNSAILAAMPVLLPSIDVQAQIVNEVDRLDDGHAKTAALLLEGVALLEELKRSLITAAVTGEFDVSAADGSRVPV